MQQDDFSGQTIKGYALKSRVGAGGFGAVYRAHQSAVRRDVAVKVILPQYANHPDFIRRFEAEAQIVARLEHPYIVPLYDYWRDADGAFLVMRWFQGTLRRMINRTILSPETVAVLLDQISGGLMIAHRRGVVHRDLKTDNILIDEDNNAFITDFGIAKDLTITEDESEAGQMIGTPSIMSPEQIRAEPVTARSDIYSLGLLLYEMLTGDMAFQAFSMTDLIMKHLYEKVPSITLNRTDLPSDLGNRIDAVIQQATAKPPEHRYVDTYTMASAYRAALSGYGRQAFDEAAIDRPATPAQPSSAQRNPTARPEPEDNTPENTIALADSGKHTARPTDTDLPTNPAIDANDDPNRSLVTKIIVVSPLPPPALDNPYKGLRAFQEADSADFFGRDQLIARLIDRLGGTDARFLAVVGPSGSGKSSAVRAGVIPALRKGALPGSDRWFIVTLTPGALPFEEMTAALLRIAVSPPADLRAQLEAGEDGLLKAIRQSLPPGAADSRLLLVIDQFEEVFTLVDSEAIRARFLNSLVTALSAPDSPLALILTVRADFYDRPLHYARFGELLRQHTEVVLPLTPDELAQAIVKPAERVGLDVDPTLIPAIAADLDEQPGSLPLLEYALTELFERRTGRKLTLSGYQASGGVLGALTRRAEVIYAGLHPSEQAAAQQMFLRLVTPGEGVEDTRRRALRQELTALTDPPEAIEAVIDRYSQHYLLTFDRDPATRAPTVEIAHEALIRRWARLREWLDTNRDDLIAQRRLSQAVGEWQNGGRDPSFLASGVRLEQFKLLIEKPGIPISPIEREYAAASITAQEADRKRLQAEATRQRTIARRMQALSSILIVFLLITAALSIFAFNSRSQAISSAATATLAQGEAIDAGATAQANYQHAESSRLASEANGILQSQTSSVDLAALLSVHALQIAYSPDADAASVQAAARLYTVQRLVADSSDTPKGVVSAAFSPDGQFLVTGGGNGQVKQWNPQTGALIATMPSAASSHPSIIRALAVASDGTVIVGKDDGTIAFWHGANLKSIALGTPITSLALAPDGKSIAAGLNDAKSIAVIVDLSGHVLQTFSGHTAVVTSVAFSPDGTQIVTGSADKSARLWQVASGQLIRALNGHTDSVSSVAFSADSKFILTGSYDKTARLWDSTTGTLIRTFAGHADAVTSVAFSPDGQSIVTASHDHTARIWLTANGTASRLLSGHDNWVDVALFAPDGKSVLTGSEDATARRWTLIGTGVIESLIGHDGPVYSVTASPDGKLILTASDDTTARIWDAHSLTTITTLSGHTDTVTSAAFSPDGSLVLTGSLDGTARIWNAKTGQVQHTLTGHRGGINAVAISPDGRFGLTASADQTARLWDLRTGQLIRELAGHTDIVTSAAFSPDGKWIVTGSVDQTARIWDVATGQPIRTLSGHTGAVTSVAFSPDGKSILTGRADKTLRLWDSGSGDLIKTFAGQSAKVNGVAFSPDGTLVAASSNDKTAWVWNVATGQVVRQLIGHTDIVESVAFSPDSQQVYTASYDGTVRIWDVNVNQWITHLCSNLTRDLTSVERQRYQISGSDSSATCGVHPQ